MSEYWFLWRYMNYDGCDEVDCYHIRTHIFTDKRGWSTQCCEVHYLDWLDCYRVGRDKDGVMEVVSGLQR